VGWGNRLCDKIEGLLVLIFLEEEEEKEEE
jgi:hypothetical protein